MTSKQRLIPFHAFTLKANSRAFEIISDVGVSELFIQGEKNSSEKIHRTRALWDTGATSSAITIETARKLSLFPISRAQVHHADGVSEVNVYLVNFFLPNNTLIQNVRVTECKETLGNFGVIIGMDVIGMGDFSITNVGAFTTFSFRIPSIKTIDYVDEANEINRNAVVGNQNVGRNDPCPCGSGLKFKKCHGKNG